MTFFLFQLFALEEKRYATATNIEKKLDGLIDDLYLILIRQVAHLQREAPACDAVNVYRNFSSANQRGSVRVEWLGCWTCDQ